MYFKILSVLVVTLFSTACATISPAEEDPRDPLQSINRPIWDFNYDVLDNYVLRPAAKGYQYATPKPVRLGFLNMANNLEEPSAIVNNLLQAKPKDAAISAGRFVINSTVGLLGLVDVAQYAGMKEKREEFGEVLGKWGVGNGPYLMLPAMGPSDVRNTTGDIIDSAYFPLNDLTGVVAVFRISVKALESRISLMDQERLLEDSFDPYIFVKDAYFQRSEFEVYDGKMSEEKQAEKAEDLNEYEAFLKEMESQ